MMSKFALCGCAAMTAAGVCHGQVLYSTGFEAPLYTAGAGIGGIDNWFNGSGTGVSQTVSTAMASEGSQSLRWDNTASQSFYSVRRAMPVITEAVSVSVDLWITGNTEVNRLYGIYFVSTASSTLGGNTLGLTLGGDGTVRGGKLWSNTYTNNNIIGVAPAGTYLDRWVTLTLTWDPITAEGTISVSGLGGGAPPIGAAFESVAVPLGLNLGTDYAELSIRSGMAYMDNLVIRQGASGCYPNCDGSTVEPILNIDDFTCFINEFASAQSLPHEQQVSHYANCDGSTVAPALNIDDFTCFINEFAAGCR